MEFPDKWLACDKVPKDLRDMFETRIGMEKRYKRN
jgi:hypothetical protein